MSIYLYAKQKDNSGGNKVKHYIGIPPNLSSDIDTRRAMNRPYIVIIVIDDDGVVVYRFDVNKKCVGDTWHIDKDEALNQAKYEFDLLENDWHLLAEHTNDPINYILSLF